MNPAGGLALETPSDCLKVCLPGRRPPDNVADSVPREAEHVEVQAEPAVAAAPALMPDSALGAAIFGLQRSAGNLAVTRMLEQRAAAQAVQRVPAAPTYQGQTGARDLSKITIDAVPDFLLSSLTAPKVVNPHCLDPAIKHITWAFYDPADQMMSGSYSTLPGRADSTTRPFTIESSQFGTPATFRSGRYLLRLIGLDDQHRPVAYADRDFNVLSADLTTGTAAATGHGQLTFTRYNAINAVAAVPATATTAAVPAQRWKLDVELSFLPDAAVQSTDVVFIQSVQVLDLQGNSLQRRVNAEQDARKTPLAWSIDRVAGAPQPFYISGRNAAGAVADNPTWGRAGSGGATPGATTLIDAPSGPPGFGVMMKFESCAVSRSGPTAGECYGCATWGFSVDSAGRMSTMPRGITAMPSPEFEEARQMWNTWRAGRPAASRPTEAPATRSP
jgi:hypothetical protein